MSTVKKHSNRRAFLRGVAGSVLLLPLLEYTHGESWAAEGTHLRFITGFSHGGTISNQTGAGKDSGNGAHHGVDLWRPSDPASSVLQLGPIHQPLEPWVSKLTLLESIDNRTGKAQGAYAGGHRYCNSTALTAADIVYEGTQTEQNARSSAPSIDQVISAHLAGTQSASLPHATFRVGSTAYGSPYYRGAKDRINGFDDPLEAFNFIFDGVSTGEPTPEELRRKAIRQSTLDGLADDYRRLRQRVSSSDRQVIDAHLDHLSALENQLNVQVACTPPENVPSNPAGLRERADLLADILVATVRCGLTDVANIQIGDIDTPWTLNAGASGMGVGHSFGHMARDIGPNGPKADKYQAWMDQALENRQWRMGVFARVIAGLDDPDFLEGGNTILDNSLMLMTSEFSAASKHSSYNQPILLAGSAGKQLQTGRYVNYNQHAVSDPNTTQYASNESLHNLFVSILGLYGMDVPHFGSNDAAHTGPLPNFLG